MTHSILYRTAIISFCYLSLIKGSTSNFTFNRDTTLVLFNPYVSLRADLGEEKLSKLISTVSSSFSKIVNFAIPLSPRYPLAEGIPKEIAKYNVKLKKEGKKPIEVYLPFQHTGADGLTHGNPDLLNLSFSIANEANSIFNGTVKNIFVWFGSGIRDDNISPITTSYLKLLDNSSVKYRFGADLSLKLCNFEGNLEFFKHIQFVTFYRHTVSGEFYNIGVERTVSQFIKEFERCKRKVEVSGLKFEVIFVTSWFDTDHNGVQNYSSFVYFWETMGNWSVKSNTKVVLMQAFDIPFVGGISRLGWWRTVDEEHLIFQEKKISAAKEMERFFDERRGNATVINAQNTFSLSTTWIIIAAVISFIIGLALVGLVSGLTYRRLMNRIKYPSVLTKKEINDFFNGEQIGVRNGILPEPWKAMAYDKNYEVASGELEIDEEVILGTGSFKMTCLGKVRREGESVCVDVAVRKLKANCPGAYIKKMLNEIKILSYLGQCENILGLVGVNSKGIKDGRVMVMTEYCSEGTLEKYLREKRPLICTHSGSHYDDLTEDGFELAEDSSPVCKHNNPYKWSLEIARGMEFITSKKVVHTHLATRNILLTENLTVKISGFGLRERANKSCEYSQWRWMSPESLEKLEFNEKTDVWAFGVTLWEIYSLGDVPYKGRKMDSKFTTALNEGIRLEKPELCNDWIYERMLNCWEIEPTHRPTFKELLLEFLK